jgi:hypothetical protein
MHHIHLSTEKARAELLISVLPYTEGQVSEANTKCVKMEERGKPVSKQLEQSHL